MIDIASGLTACVGKYSLHNTCRHFFHEIGSIIRHQIIDNVCSILIGKRCNDQLLIIHVQIRENVCSQVLGQDTEHLHHVFLFQFFHLTGYIRLIQFCQILTKLCVLLCIKQFSQLIGIF